MDSNCNLNIDLHYKNVYYVLFYMILTTRTLASTKEILSKAVKLITAKTYNTVTA